MLEEDSSEVEDEVNTSKLLHHLHTNTKESTAQVGGTIAKTTLEAVGPTTHVGGLRDNRHLILVIGDDFSQFILDVVGVHRLATD